MRIVVALGGNALLKRGEAMTSRKQTMGVDMGKAGVLVSRIAWLVFALAAGWTGGALAAEELTVEQQVAIDVTATWEAIAHQCATPDAAPSSTSAPVANLPRSKASINGCGRPFAMVQAIVSPPAGIAL